MISEKKSKIAMDINTFFSTKKQMILLIGIMIAVFILFNILSDGIFLSGRNISILLRQASILAIIAAGMCLIMISGNFDLSVGAAIYLISVMTALLSKGGMNTALVVIITLALGAVLALFEGYFIAYQKLPAFIVTLAGFLVFRGIGYEWMNSESIFGVQRSLQFLSEGFIPIKYSIIGIGTVTLIVIVFNFINGRKGQIFTTIFRSVGILIVAGLFTYVIATYQGIPMAVLIMLIVVFSLNFLATRTRFGRNVYAIGNNSEAAALAGINIPKHILLSFLIMGLMYGFGGFLITARLSGNSPSIGLQWELDAIAAAVIGGTHIGGGVGSIFGALMGAILIKSLDNGLSILNISYFIQMIIKGLVLLFAIFIDKKFHK